MNDSEAWVLLGRATTSGDSCTDIEIADFRATAASIGLCADSFPWVGEDAPTDKMGEDEC